MSHNPFLCQFLAFVVVVVVVVVVVFNVSRRTFFMFQVLGLSAATFDFLISFRRINKN